MKYTDDIGCHVVKTFEKLKADRLSLETIWRDAYRWTLPKRGQLFLNKSPISGASTFQNYQASIYDGTAIEAVRLLASSMLSGLTPSNSLWFKLGVQVDESKLGQESKTWFDDSSNTMFREIHNSNYDAQALEFFLDISIGGMSGLYVEDKEGTPVFEEWPLDQLYVQSMMDREVIDTVYRCCSITGQEAEEKFGKNNLPDHIKTKLDNDPYCTEKFSFIHRIAPRVKKNGKQAAGRIKTNLPFESVYVCEKTKQVVYESGYHEFPVVVPRWMLIPNTDYATGPIDEALPDIKTINKLRELHLRGTELAILPPLKAKDDGVINPNAVVIGPSRIIPVADIENLQPLMTGTKFDIASVEFDRLQNQIKRIMMSDILQPLDKPQMTATEVQQRMNIVRRLLGPVYSRLQAEFLKPLLYRVYGILLRAGKIAPPPEELAGLVVTPIFLSPQARAQRMEEVASMDSYEMALGQQAQVNPEVLDNYDIDAATRHRSDLMGVPAKLMRDERKVKQLREQRAKQIAEQQALQAQSEAA